MNLRVIPIRDLPLKSKTEIDKFIMDDTSNGEFINTIRYLSYHPCDRFTDDSIIVKDISSGLIKGMIMAGQKGNVDEIISHPGTTFSGPILKKKQSITEIEEIINLMISYYKKKYKQIQINMPPSIYSSQPFQEIEYFLLKNKFCFGYSGLVNVIDLKKLNGESDIFNLYNGKRRNHVKKSINDSLYNFYQQENICKKIWDSMNENLHKKFNSNTTHSFEELDDLIKKFPQNIIPYVAMKDDGQYGAFALVYKFKNVFHTQYLDLNYECRGEYPNLFLIHNLIKMANEEGFKYFSFGGSTEKGGEYLNQGLYNYKAGFGGGSILLPVYRNY